MTEEGALECVTQRRRTGSAAPWACFSFKCQTDRSDPIASDPIASTGSDLLWKLTTPPSGTGDPSQTTVYEYDVAGRAWKVTHPDGGIVNTTYTPRGEVATTYGARSYPVEHTYDSQGRMKTLKTWQNKTAGTGVAVTTWTYDIYRGWLTAKKYEGRTTSVEYEYTPGGRLKLRRWERNASTGGRLVTTYRHGIPAESALGLPADGGLHRIEYGATTVGTPEVRYTYDRAGRRISTRQFNGATELRRVDWQPDETGAFGTETLVESGATTFTLTRGADSVLRPGSLTLQRTATNVLAMTYGYDTASRLTSVSDGTLSATYAYQANSDLLSTITLRNGATTRLTTTRVYDRWGRLQSQWAVANAASVQPVVGSGYTYNGAGQRIRQDLGDGTYWTYAYDTMGQLTGAQRRWPDGTLVAGQQYGYLYDDIGNRKQSLEGGDANGAGLQTTTYTANLLNQYSGITTPGVASVNGLANATNTVTVNGAATVRQGEYWWRETSVANASAPVWASLNVAASNGGTTNTTVNRYVPKANETPTYDDDGRWIYRWDAENRLVEMETTSTAITAGVPYAKVRWTYDPLGRRIQRESWQGASPVVVTRYVYDGWQCLAELDGSNAVTATYAWGLDLSGSRTGAGGVGGLLWVNHTQHGRHFYSYDGNGNVCGLTSGSDGTRTGGYEYDPFGGIIRASEPHPVAGWNEWSFSTKRTCRAGGCILYEFRAYSSLRGRWLSADPIGERGGFNTYGLTINDPISQFDRLGLVGGGERGDDHLSSIAVDSCALNLVVGHMMGDGLEGLNRFLGHDAPRNCSSPRIGFYTCGSDYLTAQLPPANAFPLLPELWGKSASSILTPKEEEDVNSLKYSLPNTRNLPYIGNHNTTPGSGGLDRAVRIVEYAKANACKKVCCKEVRIVVICSGDTAKKWGREIEMAKGWNRDIAEPRGLARDTNADLENPCGKSFMVTCDEK